MILLDTCAILHSALNSDKLGKQVTHLIHTGIKSNNLACSDISLWEIALLIRRQRIKFDASPAMFIDRTLLAHRLTVLPITPEIALKATDDSLFIHKDPADRIIAATALCHRIPLITCDSAMHSVKGLEVVW